jgi:hypothetical protein
MSFVSGQVAQLVERSPEKAGVGGSIPSLATIPNVPRFITLWALRVLGKPEAGFTIHSESYLIPGASVVTMGPRAPRTHAARKSECTADTTRGAS